MTKEAVEQQGLNFVGPRTMLAATRKLMGINKGEAEADDRDSLANQTFYGPEDFFAERIRKDAGGVGRKLLWKSTGAGKLRGVNSGALSPQLRGVLLNSGLGSPIEEINPLEIYDQQVRVLRLGEGGIPSREAIPEESKGVQPSQFGFIDPIRGPECFDELTEVFTSKGWIAWPDAKADTEFAVLLNGRLAFARASRIVAEHYEGLMYGARTKYLDYLVTPGHRLYSACVHTGTRSFAFREAMKEHGRNRAFLCGGFEPYAGTLMVTHFRLPEVERGSNVQKEAPLIDAGDFAEFLGLYLTEGSCTCVRGGDGRSSNYSVAITQTKEPNRTEIGKLLKRLPFSWSYGARAWRCCGKQLATYLKQFGVCHEKFIPEEFFHMSAEVRGRLLHGLILGDGRSGKGKQDFRVTSKRLADGFQRLAISLGYSTNVGFEADDREERYLGCYRVSLHRRNTRDVQKKKYYYTQEYSGMVYCATVPGGLLYVRRGRGVGHWSGNSEALGVDTRLAFGTFKGDDGQIYSSFTDVRTGEPRKVSAREASRLVIAFPGEMGREGRKVRAMVRGKLEYVDKGEVDLELPAPHEMFNTSVNLVPMPNATQGNRLFMAGKMFNQALPLQRAEAPLVRSAVPGGGSFEQLVGNKLGVVRAEQPGQVTKVDRTGVTVKNADGSKRVYELYDAFPMNRKTYIQNRSMVKPGDKVEPGQLLAASNFTDDEGTAALGTNLRVAFMPYKGLSVSGDTRVLWQDSDGINHFGRIRDIDTSRPVKAAGLPDSLSPGLLDVQAYIAHRAAVPMCTVRTLDGDSITATRSHSFVTLNDRGELVPIYPEDMNTDGRADKTLVPVVPLPGLFTGDIKELREAAGRKGANVVDIPLDADAGFLFGMYIAEGWVVGGPSKCKSVGLAVTEQDLIDRLSAICTRHGWSYVVNLYDRDGGKSGVFTIYNAALARVMKKYCGSGCTNKRLPSLLWSASREFACGLLDGYWCGDGTVTDKQALASTTSRRLADELCALLSGLGMRATHRSYKYKRNRRIYLIKVFQYSLHVFPHLTLERKQRALTELCESELKYSRDRIPIPRAFRAAVGRVVGAQVPTSGYISRGKLLPHLEELPTVIADLVRAPIWWDVVTAVEPADDEAVVFDLDMSPVGNFAVNGGLIVHNTYEDAYVISESAAKKLASEHMYTPDFNKEKGVETGRQKFLSLFPGVYGRKQLETIGEDGVVKPGTRVKKGDPLVLAVGDMEHRAEGQWSQLSKAGRRKLRDRSLVWEHDFDGEVTDAEATDGGVKLAVRAFTPMREADKLSARFGDKGVVAKIVPDDHMPRDAQGRPYEVLQNPLTLPSRMNPAQVYEMLLAKVARKTGKPVEMPQFEEEDLAEFVDKQLRQHGLTDVEAVYDPEANREIKDVLAGEKFFMKLHHTAESKWGARGTEGYTAEGVPARGGREGAKTIANLGLNALLSHGATDVMRDSKLYRAQRNDDFWRAYQLGYTPPAPKEPLVYRKFLDHLRGSGINVLRTGNQVNIMAMTDDDVGKLSRGAVRLPDTVSDKDLSPKDGGLFDRGLTGGHGGQHWTHIELDEPLPNPIMEEPIRRLLGLTQKQLEAVVSGAAKIGEKSGGEAIRSALAGIDVEKEADALRAAVKTKTGAGRNDAVKKLRYLEMLKKTGIRPEQLVISKVPVLPPLYRPINRIGDDQSVVADANYLYQDLLFGNEALKGVKKEMGGEGAADERLNLYKALKAVTGLGDPVHPKLQEKKVRGLLRHVFGKKSPKGGLYQRRVIGMATDVTGRAAITPNPQLDMDQVGLPEEQAWTSYKPFVIRRLTRRGLPATQAAKMVEERHPQAKQELVREMERRPIMITRAPVLSRYGLMAAYPKLVKGDSLQISPIVTSGFVADFDGDQQIDHVYVLMEKELANELQSVILQSITDKESEMTARFKHVIPTLEGKVLSLLHLSEFPHGPKVRTTQGRHGPIDWYEVPAGVSVVAYDEQARELVEKPVQYWTEHHGCEVCIVRLKSGREIFTDDDPRAVYGIPAGELLPDRFTPEQALAKRVMVPRMRHLSLELPRLERVATLQVSGDLKLVPEVTLDLDFGYLLGLLVGDGWVAHVDGVPKDVVLAGVAWELVERADEIIEKLFGGCGPRRCTVESTASYGESRRHTWSSLALAEFVRPLIGCGSRQKHLPEFFLHAPKEFREGLFSGLLDTDGSISISISNGKKRPQLMSNYFSTSLRLVQEVQLLAASLDISSRITATKTPAGLPAWTVGFSSVDLKRWGGQNLRHPRKREVLATTEVVGGPAYVRQDLVPMPKTLAAAIMRALPTPKDRKLWPEGQASVYNTTVSAGRNGYMPRASANAVVKYLGRAHAVFADWAGWLALVDDCDTTWDLVEAVEPTGQSEVGYDLTVPGAETFMSASGVVLSNTMSYHVPVSDEAIDEARQKMLPSKNLLHAKDFKAHYTPTQEYLYGLYLASKKKEKGKGRTHEFATKADALRAYRRGEIGLQDEVVIRGS